MKTDAPSPMTKPSAPSAYGRVPVAESAPILQNFTNVDGAHVAVDAAGDRRVVLALDETLDRGAHRGHRRTRTRRR